MCSWSELSGLRREFNRQIEAQSVKIGLGFSGLGWDFVSGLVVGAGFWPAGVVT